MKTFIYEATVVVLLYCIAVWFLLSWDADAYYLRPNTVGANSVWIGVWIGVIFCLYRIKSKGLLNFKTAFQCAFLIFMSALFVDWVTDAFMLHWIDRSILAQKAAIEYQSLLVEIAQMGRSMTDTEEAFKKNYIEKYFFQNMLGVLIFEAPFCTVKALFLASVFQIKTVSG